MSCLQIISLSKIFDTVWAQRAHWGVASFFYPGTRSSSIQQGSQMEARWVRVQFSSYTNFSRVGSRMNRAAPSQRLLLIFIRKSKETISKMLQERGRWSPRPKAKRGLRAAGRVWEWVENYR